VPHFVSDLKIFEVTISLFKFSNFPTPGVNSELTPTQTSTGQIEEKPMTVFSSIGNPVLVWVADTNEWWRLGTTPCILVPKLVKLHKKKMISYLINILSIPQCDFFIR
jgi:hypothetical protein